MQNYQSQEEPGVSQFAREKKNYTNTQMIKMLGLSENNWYYNYAYEVSANKWKERKPQIRNRKHKQELKNFRAENYNNQNKICTV